MKIYILGKKDGVMPMENMDVVKDYRFFDKQDEQHLIFMSVEEFIENKHLFNFPVKAYEQTVDSKQTPNAEFFDNLLFLTLNDVEYCQNKQQFDIREINVYLGTTNILIVFHNKSKSLDEVVSKVDKTNIYRALYSFLDGVLDLHKKAILSIEKMTMSLEDKILKSTIQTTKNSRENMASSSDKVDRKQNDEYLVELVRIRKLIQYVRRYFDNTADVLEIVEIDESNLIPREYDKFFNKLSLKSDRNSTNLVHLRDYLVQVREAWQGQVDLELNNRMNFLTIISVIFMPLTLIAGWYGMNFRIMPELMWEHGYLFAFVLSVLVFVGSIIWLKKKKFF